MQLLIYGLTDPRTSAIRYVGKSTQGLLRPRAHARRLDGDDSHKGNWLRALQAAGIAYGIVVLERVADRGLLDEAERRWIAHGRLQGWPLTNILDGGDGAACAEETKAKLRAMNLGKRHTAAARAKMSAAHKGKPPGTAGKPVTAATRAKQSAARIGRVFTAETREKIAAAKRGKPRPDLANRNRSPEDRALLRALHEMARGRPRPDLVARNRSDENRAKVAAALRGRQFSEETLEKMREGQRRRWKRQRLDGI